MTRIKFISEQMNSRTLILVFSAIALLLAIPAVSMQFTDEVNWTLWDFLVAALLLLIFAATLLYIRNNIRARKRRILFYLASIFIFLAIWAELAVGVIEHLR